MQWLVNGWIVNDWMVDDEGKMMDGWCLCHKHKKHKKHHAFSRCLLPPWAAQWGHDWSVKRRALQETSRNHRETTIFLSERSMVHTKFGFKSDTPSENIPEYCWHRGEKKRKSHTTKRTNPDESIKKIFSLGPCHGTCGRNWHILRPHWPTTPRVNERWIGWGIRNVQRRTHLHV